MADRLPFTKMQGIGNDFIVVDARNGISLDWSALSPEICDRHTGIGADGLLVLENTRFADVVMRMYNPDGTPDVCGNGLRCLSRYVFETDKVSTDILKVATLAGVRTATCLHTSDSTDCCDQISVEMGEPRFLPADIPARLGSNEVFDFPLDLGDGGSLTITALSTGSTHAVSFVQELPTDSVFFAVSPIVEQHPAFPERTSLMWCVVEGRSRIRLRVWERGVGETLGCGTGACAAAVAAIKHGFVDSDKPVTVASGGGELHITWQPGSQIHMRGPAEYVFTGEYDYTGRAVTD